MCLQVTDTSAVIELVCVDVPTLLCSVVFFHPFQSSFALVSIQDPRFPEDGVVELLFSEIANRDLSLASGILTFLWKERCFMDLCECGLFNMAGSGRLI